MNNYSLPKTYIKRGLESDIRKFMFDREIIVIRGPRQSGKTTLMSKIYSNLKEKGRKVVFISLEDDLERVKLEKDPKKYFEFYLRGEHKKVFFFLDEIQYVKNGGKILKLIFDSTPNIKLFVSGSSTLDLSKLGEFLVGRAVFFELMPFSFAEFLETKDSKLSMEYQENRVSLAKPKIYNSIYLKELNNLFLEYITFGGYPRVVLEKKPEKKKILLRNIFSTYVEKDIAGLYGLKYKDKALGVLKYIAASSGSVINYSDITQSLSLHFGELKEILGIFEETYILGKATPFKKNLITELKKNPKYYFLDLGLRNTLLERFIFSDQELGKVLENYAFLVLRPRKPSFWRTTAKAEVDFVINFTDKPLPLEVKKTPKVSRSLLSFLNTYHPPLAVLATWEASEKKKINNTSLVTAPLALF